MSVREESVVAPRSTSEAIGVLPPRVVARSFNLVGLHWRGAGKVYFRTAGVRGWSPWRFARPEADDLPDLRSAEAERAGGWKLGNPFWTGKANRIQYRLVGEVDRLRSYLVRSAVSSTPRTFARATRPPIVLRSGWGADETIVRSAPWYADRIGFAVVHHTAGAQPSTPAQSAAIVRAIQRYHVQGNGWNDIGYNFLVDRFGQVFEGRAGGIARNVVGAHAQGFNTGSVGVAVLGTYSSVGIEQPAKDALVALLAWRLDVAHVDPDSTVVWRSGGNPRYPAGTPVLLRAVSGHRDTGPTSCPGQILYETLPDLAALTAAVGLPKIYDPRITGSIGDQVRFTARLSTAESWTVTVTRRDGSIAASGSGTGSAVAWTWDATAAAPGSYTWRIAAGLARPASGRLGADPPPPLSLESVRADPAVVSPNGDRVADRSVIRFQPHRARLGHCLRSRRRREARGDHLPGSRVSGRAVLRCLERRATRWRSAGGRALYGRGRGHGRRRASCPHSSRGHRPDAWSAQCEPVSVLAQRRPAPRHRGDRLHAGAPGRRPGADLQRLEPHDHAPVEKPRGRATFPRMERPPARPGGDRRFLPSGGDRDYGSRYPEAGGKPGDRHDEAANLTRTGGASPERNPCAVRPQRAGCRSAVARRAGGSRFGRAPGDASSGAASRGVQSGSSRGTVPRTRAAPSGFASARSSARKRRRRSRSGAVRRPVRPRVSRSGRLRSPGRSCPRL